MASSRIPQARPTPLAPEPHDPVFPAYQQFLHLGEAGLAASIYFVVGARHFAPEDQRDEQERSGDREERNPGRILLAVNGSSRGGHDPGSDCQEDDPDGHIDEEYGPPPASGHICGDQPAADDLPGDCRERYDGGVDTEGTRTCRPLKLPLDHGDDLRGERRRADALHDARRDERPGRPGQTAGQRRPGEERDPGEEHTALAEVVAQPGAGHQQSRVRDGVTGDHQLQRRARHVQVLLNARAGHVDDGHVHGGHERAHEQHQQSQRRVCRYGRG